VLLFDVQPDIYEEPYEYIEFAIRSSMDKNNIMIFHNNSNGLKYVD